MDLEKVKALIKETPDFPKPGVLFRDIHPILRNPEARAHVTEILIQRYSTQKVDAVVGLETRGYYYGIMLAEALKVPFVPFRKPGKTPGEIFLVEYKLEYGTDKLCVGKDALSAGQRIVIIDDLMATGGTASASVQLAHVAGTTVVEFHCIVELVDLKGKDKLPVGVPLFSLFKY